MKQLFIVSLTFSFLTGLVGSAKPSPEEVKVISQKVADWQVRTFDDAFKYRGVSHRDAQRFKKAGRPIKQHHELDWTMGALYVGMNQWRKVSGDQGIENFLLKIGNRNGWKPHKRPYHADSHAVGQTFLSLYEEYKEPEMLEPFQKHFDWILANPKTGSLKWGKGNDSQNRWGWCDALFMAPPVWARMAKVTGERKYLDFMHQEYRATYDLLWDREDHLFWRDSSFFERREKNGRKLYWARGNGWVFGGLAMMIPDLPSDWKEREFYLDLFKQMAESIKDCQRKDGTWSMGLLGDVESYPIKETSGTSFFTFGLAWGINNGLLDRKIYEPIVIKGWEALTQCVNEEGMLGYVQPIGAAPDDCFPDKTEVYGIGAFLAAGAEVYQLVGGHVSQKPKGIK